MASNHYSPKDVFAGANETPPRVLVAPQRYIQGAGVINHIGRYLSSLNVNRAGILASSRGLKAQGVQVADSLKSRNIDSVNSQFDGECSLPNIESHVEELQHQQIDCLIAVGGGKLADAGKCIAYRLGVPVVVVPTLASNDAPCSALSVLYTPEGNKDCVEYFPQSPAMVVMDTDIVASAGERYFVAGMGDAMATCYEARVCLNNPAARTLLGARPTLASGAMGEICAQTLYQYGEVAAESVAASRNNEAVEMVVEANTLLSGLGFESGGLAVAHPMALAYTEIGEVRENYLHGEMVAMGTMAQLALEQSDDAERVARFFARVGLPVHLGQLSLSLGHEGELETIINAAMANPIAHHMPMQLTHDSLRQAIRDAHYLGLSMTREVGDEAYQRLHH